MDVLQVDSLSKKYGRIQALNKVSFSVAPGSVFGILGPNGSGKTTLLSLILDVLKADSGQFRWFGKPGSPEMRCKIGSLLETPNFYHYLSGVYNLRVTQTISGRGSREDIDEVLRKVNLYERRNSRFSSYSLGMKQRLAIASTLLGDPKVLVLDEPTNGLDPVGIAEIRRLITELQQSGHTIIMASHLLDEVEKICTHVAILKTGNLLISGPVDEVLRDEDLVEIGAEDISRLFDLAAKYGQDLNVKKENNRVLLHFPRGQARLDDINRYFADQGIFLNHLMLKKKKLETRFFELTNNN